LARSVTTAAMLPPDAVADDGQPRRVHVERLRVLDRVEHRRVRLLVLRRVLGLGELT
jgi:hypothetical protein